MFSGWPQHGNRCKVWSWSWRYVKEQLSFGWTVTPFYLHSLHRSISQSIFGFDSRWESLLECFPINSIQLLLNYCDKKKISYQAFARLRPSAFALLCRTPIHSPEMYTNVVLSACLLHQPYVKLFIVYCCVLSSTSLFALFLPLWASPIFSMVQLLLNIFVWPNKPMVRNVPHFMIMSCPPPPLSPFFCLSLHSFSCSTGRGRISKK